MLLSFDNRNEYEDDEEDDFPMPNFDDDEDCSMLQPGPPYTQIDSAL